MDAEERAQQQQQQQQPLPDVQKLWEKAQIEVALEGSNGCKLERLWHLLGLTPNVGGGDGSTESASSHAGGGATSTSTTATAPAVGGDGGGDGDDPKIFLRGWLWRTLVARRGKELIIVTYDQKGESMALKIGDKEDSRLCKIEDVELLSQADQRRVGVVALLPLRLAALGLGTASLKEMSVASTTYFQVLEVVGQFRERGADLDDVLQHVNALNKSNRKDDYKNVVSRDALKGDARTAGGMTAQHLYPVYDRLVKAGLLFKSIVQKPLLGEDEEEDSLGRFTRLYLTRFRDNILLEKGCRLEPTAKEVFLDMLVDHLSQLVGGVGTVVPWHNVRLALFPKKKVAGRVKNLLEKESGKKDFPIKLQMLDVRNMDYDADRRNRRLEPCVSLKPTEEAGSELRTPVGLSIYRAVAGIVKSRGEQGATIQLLGNKLGFTSKSGSRICQTILDHPKVYGIHRGYDRVGRCGKVLALMYDPEGSSAKSDREDLSGAASKKVPSTGKQPPARSSKSTSGVHPEPDSEDLLSVGVSGGATTTAADGVGGGSGGKGKEARKRKTVDEKEGSLLHWDDDAQLDALMDMVDTETKVSQGEEISIPEEWIERRVKWEQNPTFPPEDASEETLAKWRVMVPAERRKMLMMHEIEHFTAVTTVKLGWMIKQMEGPGPTMHKNTLMGLVDSLVKQGKAKIATAPQQPGKPLKCMWGNTMLVHKNAPTDPASMMIYAQKVRKLEDAVTARLAKIRGQDFRGGKYKWNVAASTGRFMVHERKMHRTMILHRELLRCLPAAGPGRKIGSRILDLDSVILDVPVGVFMTMFGYPPNYLFSDEMRKVLRKCEKLKNTVRNSPRAIWEMIGSVEWYKEALTSSLQALHDMKVLTKIDPPPSAAATGTAGAQAAGGRSYAHATVQSAPCDGDGTLDQRGSPKPIVGPSSKAEFERALATAKAATERLNGDDMLPVTFRERRRDRKARGAAAEALLNISDPPKDIRMGLGWACLHVDLAVYTEEQRFTEHKRVTGHIQWTDFWGCYQFYGTGKRDTLVGDSGREGSHPLHWSATEGDASKNIPRPLAKWLLEKVPELANQQDWDVVDEQDGQPHHGNAWHRITRAWSEEEDQLLLDAVVKFKPGAAEYPEGSKSTRAIRYDMNPKLKVALRPVAEQLNKTPEACWKRYKRLAEVLSTSTAPDFIAHPLEGKLPTVRKRKAPAETTSDQKDDTKGKKRRKRGKRTGLLAEEATLFIGNREEERKLAREQAALAKSAGFEWVNEEGSWEEDGRRGGIQPRPLLAWEWTMDELAALTAIRQVLLVSDDRFDASAALARLSHFSPPLLQKAYRVLLSLRQVNILQEAWTANDHVVEDCVDHEVYKMIGRHGTTMVTRGIAAVDALHSYAFPSPWEKPKIVLRDEHGRIVEMIDRYATKPPSDVPRKPSAGVVAAGLAQSDAPTHLSLREGRVDRDMMGTLLEAIATGCVKFAVKPHELYLVDACDKVDGDVGGVTTGEGGGSAIGGGVKEPSSPASSATPGDGGREKGTTASGETRSDRDLRRDGGGQVNNDTPSAEQSDIYGDILNPIVPRPGEPSHKYRKPTLIDVPIMGTITAGIEPMPSFLLSGSEADASRHNMSARGDDGDILENSTTMDLGKYATTDDVDVVIGPEIGWGLRATANASGRRGAGPLLEALRVAGRSGMSLPDLRKAVRGNRVAGDRMPEDDRVLLAELGCALRSGEAVCVCGAGDIMYLAKESAGLWIVAANHDVDGLGDSPRPDPRHTPEPLPIESNARTVSVSAVDSMEVGDVDDDQQQSGVDSRRRPGWKGKKRAVETTAAAPLPSPPQVEAAKVAEMPRVWMPWMDLDGKVDLGLLGRLREGAVVYVKSHGGCRAGDIRSHECPFLTVGETLLILRDLVRRKVLVEDVVPDTEQATLASGWGVACAKTDQPSTIFEEAGPRSKALYTADLRGKWVNSSEGSDADNIGSAARASFSLALGWSDVLLRMQEMFPA